VSLLTLRIVTVGAGIIGASIAFRAAEAGADVTLIEAAAPAAGATSKSFGWINASFAETDDYFHLRMAALGAHHRLDADLGGSGVRWGGSLWWEEEGAAFDAHVAKLTALQYAHRVLDRTQFARLAPAIADPPDRCLLVAQEGSVEGPALTARLLSAAAAQGAHIRLGCSALGLMATGKAVTGVMTTHGPLTADVTVIAAGMGSVALLAGVGVDLPLDNKPGLILHTRPIAPVTDHLILSPDVHFRQSPDGSLVAGEIFSGDGPGRDWITSDPGRLADDVLHRLAARLPGHDIRPAVTMLGQRPVPRDGLPLVGPVGPEGLYVAAMHSGITLGPLMGELVTAELTSGPVPDLALFRPDRA
jgi:D-hydroxyproline dehydrogenase subunit beta